MPNCWYTRSATLTLLMAMIAIPAHAAAADEPLGRRPRLCERPVVELSEAAQHRVGVAGVDLREPLFRDPVAERVFAAVVENQSARYALDPGHVGRKRGQAVAHRLG